MLPRNVAWIPFDVFKPVIFSPVICCWWFCKMDISEKQYVCIMHIMLFNFHINSWLCDPPSVYFLISKQKIYHSFVLLAATIYIYLCTIVLLQILWKPTPNFACYLIIWTTYHSLQSSADCPNMLRKGNGMSACFTTIIPIPPCFLIKNLSSSYHMWMWMVDGFTWLVQCVYFLKTWNYTLSVLVPCLWLLSLKKISWVFSD